MKCVFKLFLCLVLCSTNMNAQEVICNKVDSLITAQNYILAKEKLMTCYDQDTSKLDILNSLALCQFLLGDYQIAIKYYHKLEKEENYKSDAFQKLAHMYETQQNLPKAIKYNIALNKIYPSNPVYLRKLGSLYLQGNERNQARQCYINAFELNSRDMLTVYAMAEMYFTDDEVIKADSIVSDAMKIDSSNISLSLLKSRISYKQKDFATTSKILQVLSYKTELSNSFKKMLGFSYIQIDSLEKAIYYLQASLLHENDPEMALFYLALAHEKKKAYDKAEWFYQEAAKAGISQNMPQYHNGLARVFTHQKSYNKVVQQYQKSLEYRDDPEVYFYLANAAEQIPQKTNLALSYYKKYLESADQNKEWKKISTDRIKVLKENEFMRKK
jgi:tetratricopeptide (TPR) repeat protein